METALAWYENPAFWASMAAIAAVISAFFAGLSYRKTTREMIDIVKADILILVSRARDNKEFKEIFIPSPEGILGIDRGEVSALLSKTHIKYHRNKWSKIIPAAFEELSREKFEGF